MEKQELSQLCEAIGTAMRCQLEPLIAELAELKGTTPASIAQPERKIIGYSDAEISVMTAALREYKERELAAAREQAETEEIAADVAKMRQALLLSGRVKPANAAEREWLKRQGC
ncbi:MAG: hypothetical protein K2M12_02725 [Muribaculaceae bacterium]|nr:hypothetical protein [Muribaculaceae bacterium]